MPGELQAVEYDEGLCRELYDCIECHIAFDRIYEHDHIVFNRIRELLANPFADINWLHPISGCTCFGRAITTRAPEAIMDLLLADDVVWNFKT